MESITLNDLVALVKEYVEETKPKDLTDSGALDWFVERTGYDSLEEKEKEAIIVIARSYILKHLMTGHFEHEVNVNRYSPLIESFSGALDHAITNILRIDPSYLVKQPYKEVIPALKDHSKAICASFKENEKGALIPVISSDDGIDLVIKASLALLALCHKFARTKDTPQEKENC